MLLNAPCSSGSGSKSRERGEGPEELGGLYERVAKLALDHHAAFEQDEAVEEGEGDAESEGSMPFPTLADAPSRSR